MVLQMKNLYTNLYMYPHVIVEFCIVNFDMLYGFIKIYTYIILIYITYCTMFFEIFDQFLIFFQFASLSTSTLYKTYGSIGFGHFFLKIDRMQWLTSSIYICLNKLKFARFHSIYTYNMWVQIITTCEISVWSDEHGDIGSGAALYTYMRRYDDFFYQ